MTAKRRLKVVRFPKPKTADDTRFIETLVWALDQARRGKIKGYACCFMVDVDDYKRTIELADVAEHHDHLHLLGAVREMEHGFIQRMKDDFAEKKSAPPSA